MKKHYKINFLLTLSLCLAFFAVSAQNSDELWSKNTGSEKSTAKKLSRKSIPTKFESYELNLNQLKSKLSKAPKRKDYLEKSNTVLSFPNEKGKLEKYQIFEASVMEESLQKQYPNIRSYVGKGIDNPGSVIRFSVSPLGLHAMVLRNEEGTVYIDPTTVNGDSYMVYSSKNLPSIEPFECKFDEVNSTQKTSATTTFAKTENANDGKLRTFRLAVATTGEYSQFHLDRQNISPSATDAEKKAAVLSAIVTTITRVNGIYERDVSLKMVLVANNTSIIFLDANTDNLSNTNPDNVLLDESQTVIDANIGSANYDIGHTFSTGGGGVAQLNSPCTDGQKARGITGLNSPVGDPFDIDFVSHEMGHQYGAHHTFNGDTGNCADPNRNLGTAVEPGSGSTIMSYAGICAPYDVQTRADAYFHLVSIREMWKNISTGSSTCAAISVTGNSAPTVTDLLNYTIPKSTPFILNANASDINGDNLTYTWEQLDTEITTYPLVSTATVGPAFRSISPNSSSKRYFPNQTTVNAGNLSDTWEVLPSVGRTMRFGVNVRDNRAGGGQTASKEMVVTFEGSAGPFKVTSQSAIVTWSAGTSQSITWDVANSNSAPVNCSFVNILLSTDGGLTFPTTLISNVPNDGSEDIVVPNIATTTARIKVESVGNIFYAVNAKNITVQTSEFIMNFDAISKNVCVPNIATYTFTYNTFNGFNETTTFSATGNPTGTTVTFSPTSAIANDTPVTLTISGITVSNVGTANISVTGTSTTKAKTTIVALNVFDATINAPTLISPQNNAVGVLKPHTLSWNDDVNALNYSIEIGEVNTFATLVESANVNVNFYNPQLLQPNTNYFWRVKSINICGESAFSTIFNFTTENDVCDTKNSLDTPKDIPDNNTTGVSSIINITTNKNISDVNVTVNITHPWVGDLDLMLISPKGTSVPLVESRQDDGDNYVNTGFDDSASLSIDTGSAPYTGIFRPVQNLAKFNNEQSLGNWTLKVVDSGPADVGTINGWNLEICGVPIINDDDNDGVLNAIDLCPTTTPGSLVDASGCFTLPASNFAVEITSETCPNKNNGKISISAGAIYNYIAVITGISTDGVTPITIPNKTFTNNLLLDSLTPGIYTICISVSGENFEQCFEIKVIAGEEILAEANVTFGKAAVVIKKGTAPYIIFVNGQEVFETNSQLFDVDVKNGDLLEVKTAKSCEGVFSKNIEFLNEIIAYPNPTQGVFEITIPTAQTEVVVELYSILSQLISVKTYPVVYGKVQLSLENKPTGLYFAKVNLDKPVTLKIIKQ